MVLDKQKVTNTAKFCKKYTRLGLHSREYKVQEMAPVRLQSWEILLLSERRRKVKKNSPQDIIKYPNPLKSPILDTIWDSCLRMCKRLFDSLALKTYRHWHRLGLGLHYQVNKAPTLQAKGANIHT